MRAAKKARLIFFRLTGLHGLKKRLYLNGRINRA